MSDLFHFSNHTESQLLALTNLRAGEKKAGEIISSNELNSCKYVVLGIQEDIGPQANHGNPGASNAYQAFLKKLLNMQANQFCKFDQLFLLGQVSVNKAIGTIDSMRSAIAELDQFVEELLVPIIQSNKTPIVIGGGHNNAYPIIRAFNSALGQPIHVLNIDPHADCRPLEGRHSGNPFSYAIEEGLINKYQVFGLHKTYNSQTIIDFLTKHNCQVSWYDELLSHHNIEEAWNVHLSSLNRFGLEIDLDSIAHMPTSALSPSGFSLDHVRRFLQLSKSYTPQYLHLPEGAPTNSHEENVVGKALAYLVHDFVN